MATFRPNWALISPSLMASGASSLIMEKSCLIPMLAMGSLSVLSDVLGVRIRWGLGVLYADTERKTKAEGIVPAAHLSLMSRNFQLVTRGMEGATRQWGYPCQQATCTRVVRIISLSRPTVKDV